MTTIPVFWVFDNAESLAGLGTPVPGDPIVLLQTRTISTRWPAPAPVWYSGAEPWVISDWGSLHDGLMSGYSGPVTTSPSIADIAQFQMDLVTSMGPFHQNLRFTFVGGAPTDRPQRFGIIGSLEIPDDWMTDDLSTDVRFSIFPNDVGWWWSMRAYIIQPPMWKRIARYSPAEGAMAFELDDNRATFASPITAGDLKYDIEVDGVITEQTQAFTPASGDYYGDRLFTLHVADGWSAPGWEGHIYSQVDFSFTDDATTFDGSVPATFSAPGAHVAKWRLYDHEGRSTPWIRYLVPPVAAVNGLAPYPAEDNPEIDADDAVEFVSAARDADGIIVRYDWDFGDGHTESILGDDGATVTHNYEADGLFGLSLRVFDDDGLSHQASFILNFVQSGQIGAMVRPDGSLLVAVSNNSHGVEIARYNPGQGELSRQLLSTLSNSDTPSIWQTKTGAVVTQVRDRDSGNFVRRESRDGGRTWL